MQKKKIYIAEKIFACFTIALLASMTFAAADSLRIPSPEELAKKQTSTSDAKAISNENNNNQNPFSLSSLFNLDILPLASAASGCCEINNAATQFCSEAIGEGNCKGGYFHSGVSCSQVSGCNLGVCVPRGNGECIAGKREAECKYAVGGSNLADWYDVSTISEVSACQEACCNVGSRDCNIQEKKVCENDRKGTWDSTVTDIGICNNRCVSESYGCCHKGTGAWTNTEQTNCGSSGDKFYGDGVYCSSIYESGIKPKQRVGKDDRNRQDTPLTTACYYYDSNNVREGIAQTCPADSYCKNLDATEGGYGTTAICADMNCVDTNTKTWPSKLKNGESTCLNILPGEYNPGMRSSYLQNYILRCQNGVISPDTEFDSNAKHEKVCVEGTGTDNLNHAKGINNTWSECLSCGSDWTGGVADAFGYVPIIGPLVASFVTLGGICSDGFYPGQDCSKLGAVPATDLPDQITDNHNFDTKSFVMCGRFASKADSNFDVEGGKASGRVGSYDADLWATIGSCNPIYPPGRGFSDAQDTCDNCGKGSDAITNICTEEECEHMGDCQFTQGNIGTTILAGAGISLGTCAAAEIPCAAGVAFLCPAAQALCYGFAKETGLAWYYLLLISAGTSIGIGAIGAAGATVVNQLEPTVNDNGIEKKPIGLSIVEAESIMQASITYFPAGSIAGSTLSTFTYTELINMLGLTSEQAGQRVINKIASNAATDTISKLTDQEKAALSLTEAPTGATKILADTANKKITDAAEKAVSDAKIGGVGASDIKSISIDKAGKADVTLNDPAKASGLGKTVDQIIGVAVKLVGAAINFWSAGRAVNAGTCIAESTYTPDEKQKLNETQGIDLDPNKICEKCGKKEGQWWCTEKRCQILGSDCVYKNSTVGDGSCITVKPTDISPPVIKDMRMALFEQNMISVGEWTETSIDVTDRARPHEIKYMNITLTTDENAYCKISDAANIKYDDMNDAFTSEGSYPKTHVIKNLDITAFKATNFVYTFYIKCQDANGNKMSKDENYVKFKLEAPPDYQKPEIQYIDPSMVVPYDATAINLKILAYDYNRVGECRYSFNASTSTWDKMASAGTAIQADCRSGVTDKNACDYFTKNNIPLTNAQDLNIGSDILSKLGADAHTALSDLKGLKTYNMYIACNDSRGNLEYANISLIKGSLFDVNITSPKGTIYAKKPVISVNTSRMTSCTYNIDTLQYNFTGETKLLDNAHSVQHRELAPGTYQLSIECKDIAGTLNKAETAFSIDADDVAPSIIRAYNLNDLLHIVTDKPSVCAYSIKDCNFNFADGTSMAPTDLSTVHEAVWSLDTFYIKCQNEWGAEKCTTIKPVQ